MLTITIQTIGGAMIVLGVLSLFLGMRGVIKHIDEPVGIWICLGFGNLLLFLGIIVLLGKICYGSGVISYGIFV